MRNIVGQTPRGKDFFPRENIIKRIYRRLDSGSNLYLAAPRRVGKTAIMRHLEDNPKENYEFKYIITESVDNAEKYFESLLDALNTLKTIPQKSLDAVGDFLSRIRSIGIGWLEVGFSGEHKSDSLQDLKNLLQTLETDGTKVIIMVDEFPQTLENISRKSGKGGAEQFLQFNREIRHQINENIQFILTGSIGLPIMAERLNTTKEINDLNVIEIPPLSKEEAIDFTKRLLDFAEVPYEAGAISYLLDKIEWFVPFHIQLAVQELIDNYETTNQAVNRSAVENAFDKILDMRYKSYFEHYYSRLEKTFEGNEYPFALNVLKELSNKDDLIIVSIREIAEKQGVTNYRMVLETLEFDGYIFRGSKNNETFYRFTSPVLRLWWRKYVC